MINVYRCRYCNEPFNSTNILRHEDVCFENERFLTELRRIIDDGTGRAMSRVTYRRLAVRPVSDDHLSRTFGGWDAVAEFLGLAKPFREIGRKRTGLNAPLTDAERHCCTLRMAAEQAYYPSK